MPKPRRSKGQDQRDPAGSPAFSYLLFISMALLAFFPCLLFNQAYFSSDLFQIFSHMQIFLREQLAQGHFPLWNPYLFGGQPFFANPDASMCYPLDYLTLLFPVPYCYSVFFFLHALIATSGMRFWLKRLGLSEASSRWGALLFAFSGYFWWQLINPPLISVYAWLPWLLGCLEKTSEELKFKWAFLSGLCFGVIFCCGHMQSACYAFYLGFFYFAYTLFRRHLAPGKEAHWGTALPWKKLGLALLAALWGSLPLLVQFIPADEFLRFSYRKNPVLNYDNFNATFSISPRSTYQFFFPTLGLPKGETLEEKMVEFNDQDPYKDNPYFGAAGYLGIWAPFLVLLAFWRKDKPLAWFLGGIGGAAVLTSWGYHFPLHRLACLVLPGFDLCRAPNRILEIYILCASALAALGIQRFEDSISSGKPIRWLLGMAGFYFSLLLLLSFIRPNQTWPERFSLVLGMGGILLWAYGKVLVKWGKWIFLVSLAFPLLANGWNDFSTGPATNYDFEKGFPAFSYLKTTGPLGRYFFDPDLTYQARSGKKYFTDALSRNIPQDLGVRSAGGNMAFFLQKSFDLTRLPTPLFFQLMAVKGLVWKYPIQGTPGVLHHSFPGCEVYERLSPPPYVNAPNKVQVLDDGAVLQEMKAAPFDPAQQVYLSDPLPDPIVSQLPFKKAALAYALEKDEPDDQVFKVRLDSNSLVVFSEIMYPGWKAFLDGEKTPLYIGDYTFRTVFVPAGDHRVEFRFEPVWAKPLLIGFLLWLASVIVYGLYPLWTRAARPRKMGHA